ncbi:hypothetical protein BV22DRAFT_1123595 [Leucogyrophana mollusca]|uniref:Uncharacterized protein n=1 Tax=Leucogyrophana mollusca TaxID=85980 RepID=A0ACB8B1X0_9AGAM|nr:hypothetical protein BV22DRAFT_1123595 [Leucogyrophana mollusca]
MSMPRFSPSPCTQDLELALLGPSRQLPRRFSTRALSKSNHHNQEKFEIAISQLIHHHEYNSTLILRSETISTALPPAQSQHLPDLHPHSNVHRNSSHDGRGGTQRSNSTVRSMRTMGESSPDRLARSCSRHPRRRSRYHPPAVSHLAFRYIPSCLSPTTLRIEVIFLPNTPADPTSRIYRTALALLGTLHRYSWGVLTNYQKRAKHDCLVPRETYQDMYLLMCERYNRLVDEWREVTDPLKHVFEDAFGLVSSTEYQSIDSDTDSGTAPWNTRPRPPGGFVDLGCGHGLLMHILTAEGYSGHRPPRTHVVGILPTIYPARSTCRYSRSHSGESYSSAGGASSLAGDGAGEHSGLDEHSFVASRSLGGDGTHKSSYPMYSIWLAHLSEWLGWRVEYETLKITSTRNWALVDLAFGRAQAIIAGVIQHGTFKMGKPEVRTPADLLASRASLIASGVWDHPAADKPSIVTIAERVR